jgi:hypothetical protein
MSVDPYKEAPGWYYFSFIHTDRPKGDKFVGGCYVWGNSLHMALMDTHKRGINPGGDIQIHGPIPKHLMRKIPEQDRNRLLAREEIK